MVSEIPSSKWEIRAREAEKEAFKLDNEAHSFQIKEELFLEAAKIARKSARYYELARQDTNDPLQQSINLANFHINIGNSCKSLGNFFYYSEHPARAAKFFQRAAKQYALADSQIPISLDSYVNFIQDSLAHQTQLLALVANCNGKDAKMRDDWTQALSHFMQEKKNWMKLEAIGGDYARSVKSKALTKSSEREIHICKLMISLKEKDFTGALEQVELALDAAIKAFQEDPSWFAYKEGLTSTISLKEHLNTFSSLLKQAGIADEMMHAFQQFREKTDSYLDNLASYKFEREVESYLRREFQYTYSHCNYKPPYLGRDIDVYAFKGESVVTITICECKLRFNNQPIDITEIEKFCKLVRAVRDHEKEKGMAEGKRVTLHAWFVTNSDSVEKEAVTMAKRNKIDIKYAKVPKDRECLVKDTSWQISEISDLKKNKMLKK
ncbi:hypothetical protein JW988_02250 [Candidatus Bathyarchaeota archaeon]|nr:hypothetical protein [Candidatus Bathyarchaeota archaeon]